MNRYDFTDDMGFSWERVSKAKARAAYENGLAVMIAPCKARLFTMWSMEMLISKNDPGCDCFTGFVDRVNAFEYYNCGCNETGRYTAFYLPLRYIDRFSGEPSCEGRGGAVLSYDTDALAAYGRG